MKMLKERSSSLSKTRLRVPCSYQGGKQRIAVEIVDLLLDCELQTSEYTHFYDLCCGSGAITIELLNRGISPEQITMLDISSWGVFWSSLGSGYFNLSVFQKMIKQIPMNKHEVKNYMTQLSKKPIGNLEPYIYPILQSCSFGGKQIWRKNNHWENAFFRDYWEPTKESVRKSPANPMQPRQETLLRRITNLVPASLGLTCIHDDISTIIRQPIYKNSIVYIDPPYNGTTSYAYEFNLPQFIHQFKTISDAPIFVSETKPLSDRAVHLNFGGAKGGISGVKTQKHAEWLSRL